MTIIKKKFKKRVLGLCISQGPRRKHYTDEHHKLHRTYHVNFMKLQNAFENTIRFQPDPARKVVNLKALSSI